MPARFWLLSLWIAVSLTLCACGPKQTLDQVVRCEDFKHRPDGTWVTVHDISLNYQGWNFGSFQLNYGKGTIVTRTGDSEGTRLWTALNQVCGAKQ